jgi:hypothetical protein
LAVFPYVPIMLQCMSLLLAHRCLRGTATFCPLLDKSGQRWILARGGLSAFDPTATLAVHCGNGFDGGFSLYRSAR